MISSKRLIINNDGNTLWSGPWTEFWETTDPGNGYIDLQNCGMKTIITSTSGRVLPALPVQSTCTVRRVPHSVSATGGSISNRAMLWQLLRFILKAETVTRCWDRSPETGRIRSIKPSLSICGLYLLPQYLSSVKIGFSHSSNVTNSFDLYIDDVVVSHNVPAIQNPSIGSNASFLANAQPVHAQGKYGRGVTIAVIDCGIWGHPYLQLRRCQPMARPMAVHRPVGV